LLKALKTGKAVKSYPGCTGKETKAEMARKKKFRLYIRRAFQ